MTSPPIYDGKSSISRNFFSCTYTERTDCVLNGVLHEFISENQREEKKLVQDNFLYSKSAAIRGNVLMLQ